MEKATDLFREKFFDVNRYRLGRVGRFRINRKFAQDIPDSEMTLRAEDFVNAIRYLVRLRGDDQERRSMTSTTWGIAGCGRSTSLPRTRSARVSSSFAAPCRSG